MTRPPSLQDTRAVVTGGSRGLGRSITEGLAQAGATVFATSRSGEGLPCMPGVVGMALDLAQPESIEACAAAIAESGGEIDMLVNNAGILGFHGPLLDAPANDLVDTIAVDLTGLLLLTRAVRPLLRAGGAVVNVTSGAAGRPGWAGYAVAKAAVDAATHMLREELGPEGIRVCGVNPGGLRTEMRAQAYPNENPADRPLPATITPLFLAIAAGLDPGPAVEAQQWTP